MKRKLFALLILAALLLSLFPIAALAEEPAEAETEEAAETEEPAAPEGNIWGVREDDVIWYGVYKENPVPWLVLDPNQTNMGTEGLFLLSRDLIDKTQVAFDEKSTLWEGSLAQEWCTNFADTAFSPEESELVPATDKYEPATYPNKLYGLTWREVELKGEKVFFLSVIELEQYFGSYSPENKRTVKVCSLESYYWLRSPHYYHNDYHGIVLQDRTIHDYLPDAKWSARPCINLSVQNAVFLLPAEDQGALGAVTLPAEEGKHEWKLLVPLQEHEFRAETVSADENQLTVQYSGADTGDTARLSLLVRDGNGKPLTLWRLEQPAAAEGTLQLNRAELALPEDAELFLFCERLGAAHQTNYASPLQPLSTEQAAPVTPAEPETPAETPESESPAQEGETAAPAPEGADEAETEPEPTAKPQGRSAAATDRDKLITLIAAGVAVLLGIVLIFTAIYKRSLWPILLFLLLLALATLVYIRAFHRLPELDLARLKELF